MTDSKPRDLTPEELALSQAQSGGSQTAPVQLPPETQLASAMAASPTARPDTETTTGSGAPTAPPTG